MDSRRFLPLAFLVILFSAPVFAQIDYSGGFGSDFMGCVSHLMTCLADASRTPEEYWQFPNIITYIIIPTFGVGVIVTGMITEINLFKRAHFVAPTVGAVAAMTALFSGGTGVLARLVFGLMGLWGTLVFGILFVAGGWFWFRGNRSVMNIDYNKITSVYQYSKARRSLESAIYDLQKKIATAEKDKSKQPNQTIRMDYDNRISGYNAQIVQLEARIRELDSVKERIKQKTTTQTRLSTA